MTNEQLKGLREAIDAKLNGRPWQWKYAHEDTYQFRTVKPGGLFGFSERIETFDFRAAPELVIRPWSKPEDCPSFFWLRNVENNHSYSPTGIWPDGIAVTFKGEGYFYPWLSLGKWLYSTDRKTWHKCDVTE